jgi:predicted nucleotidyltransferase
LQENYTAFLRLISKIAGELEKNNIPYIVIGGQASLIYGVPRLTQDIDITLGIDIDKAEGILEILKQLKFDIPNDNPIDFAKQTRVLYAIDRNSKIRIDFIFSFSPFERSAIENANKIKLNGNEINFCSRDDLIVFKIVAGREIDLFDVKNILAVDKNCNIKYIKNWLKEFDKFLQGNFEIKFNEIINSL